jgi:hypothetical protein
MNVGTPIMIPFHSIDSEISEQKLHFIKLLIICVWMYVTLSCPFFWETVPHHWVTGGMFQEFFMVPPSRFECPMKNGQPTLEDGTNLLSKNIVHQSPSDMV